MFGIENILGFISISFLIVAFLGPEAIYLLTHGATVGIKKALITVLGIETGCLIQVLVVSFFLSFVNFSSAFFTGLRYFGFSYLLYLAFLSFRLGFSNKKFNHSESVCSSRKLDFIGNYLQGFMINISNVNISLLLLTFLPKYILPDYLGGHSAFLVLGSIFILIGTFWCAFLVAISSFLIGPFRKSKNFLVVSSRVKGVVFLIVAFHIVGIFQKFF